jgi:hypothetical protein
MSGCASISFHSKQYLPSKVFRLPRLTRCNRRKPLIIKPAPTKEPGRALETSSMAPAAGAAHSYAVPAFSETRSCSA